MTSEMQIDTPSPPSNPPKTTTTRTNTTTNQPKTPHILHTTTYRKQPWSYFHLSLTTPTTTTIITTSPTTHSQDIDPLTATTLLHRTLSTYLGQTGSAIALNTDILRTSGREIWIRVPGPDSKAVRAALGSWVGAVEAGLVPGEKGGQGRGGDVGVSWRVVGEGRVLGRLVAGGGGDVFGI
ncbi:hypothetical protein B0J11DRAFT_188476 [Dendryphion nanum]|uniref:Ribonucleases P/MRP subunit Pop8-like domain-containing protein n=1 Tax=Dendryphion nanum TaxID=256645 RepID=A0A9P9D3R9_9PLEO|nr:hypothetical protein B0J11DRAFT_188476 [Dendryphion nanum]